MNRMGSRNLMRGLSVLAVVSLLGCTSSHHLVRTGTEPDWPDRMRREVEAGDVVTAHKHDGSSMTALVLEVGPEAFVCRTPYDRYNRYPRYEIPFSEIERLETRRPHAGRTLLMVPVALVGFAALLLIAFPPDFNMGS